MFSDLSGTIKKLMLTSSDDNGVSTGRKRQLDSGINSDHLSNELDETPLKQRRLVGDKTEENGYLTLSRRLSNWLSWMVDAPMRNYFVQSVVTAIRSPLTGRSSDITEPLEGITPESVMRDSSLPSAKSDIKSLADSNASPEWKKKRNLARSPLHTNNPFKSTQQKVNGEKHLHYVKQEIVPSGNDKSTKNLLMMPQHNNVQKKVSSRRTFQEKRELSKPSTSSGTTSFQNSIKQEPSQKNKQRSTPFPNSRKKWPPIWTAEQSIRLQEKEQYRMLLQQFTSEPLFQPVPKTSILMKDASVQNDMSQPGVDQLSKPSTSYQISPLHKKKQDEILVYSKSKPTIVEKQVSEALKRTKPIIKEKTQLFNSTMKDSSEDSGETAFITKVEPPKLRYNSVASHLRDSPFFSNKWLEDLKATIANEVAERRQKIREQELRAQELQLMREAQYSALEEEINERMKQKGTPVLLDSMDFDEEDISEAFIELTPEMEAKVEDALRPNPPEEVLAEGFKLSVTRKDMETLAGLNWLNDEIINFYMNMLMERSKLDNYPSAYAFNTFFYLKLISAGHGALKRWTRKIDIFSYDLILVPVHMGMHWCLAVIDFRYKKIQYYDSMGGQNNECLNALRCYLQEESLDKKKQEYDMSGWSLETVKNIPQQMNGSDCGMFALKYAEYITRDARINFTQAHMPYFRRRMVYEVLTKQLL